VALQRKYLKIPQSKRTSAKYTLGKLAHFVLACGSNCLYEHLHSPPEGSIVESRGTVVIAVKARVMHQKLSDCAESYSCTPSDAATVC
jgi:hypothetical protein